MTVGSHTAVRSSFSLLSSSRRELADCGEALPQPGTGVATKYDPGQSQTHVRVGS